MQTSRWSFVRRSWLAAAATAFALVSLLLFPPVRATADRLLQVFRVRSVVFFPIDPARIQQLNELDVDVPTMFVSEPEIDSSPPREVTSLEEASQGVGFTVRAPATLPGTTNESTFTVNGQTSMRFQVNVDAMRQLLAITGIDDVTIPDALGSEPITANVDPWAAQRYSGDDWTIELYQGNSPDVTLPDGVDLAALGRTGLRVLGMDEAQADQISQQIDWTSTLVVPIRPDINEVRQITINGHDGLLVHAAEEDGPNWMVYWQADDQFYVMGAEGDIDDQSVLAIANSVR